MPALTRLTLLFVILAVTALHATASPHAIAALANSGLKMAPASAGQSSPAIKETFNEEEQEFLPVEEAYLLSAWVRDGEITIHWDIEPGYYLYQEQFKLSLESGAELQVTLPAGVDKYDEYFEKNLTVYYLGATLRIALEDLPQNIPTSFALKLRSQGCAEAGLCYPPRDDYLLIDTASGSAEIVDAATFKAPKPGTMPETTQEQTSLWVALVFALVGGLILNLMPCVFPVLSIKVLSLAHADRNRLAAHGWVYTLGIVLCFCVFAAILIAAKATGAAIGWGFQLQSPLMVAALVYLFLLMGLILSGAITPSGRWMGAGQQLTQKSGLGGSFFTGVLAAVVASPCTAPFMGIALGYALTQPAAVALAVFVSLGFGMALPLLLLCYFPNLIRHLPSPGPWMDILKQALAFPLYLTAIWLLWVLGRQQDADAIALVLLGALSAALAIWLWRQHSANSLIKWSLRGIAAIAVAAALLLPYFGLSQDDQDTRWQAYSPELLQRLRDDKRPVLVNMTADWCLTCLANERLTLATDEMEAAFDEYGVATVKGDWTNRDPQITQLLESYGRTSVPLYIWYAPGSSGPGKVLPQLLRKEHLRQVFSEINNK